MSKVATLLTISEIFENRFFKIPDYQRGYSWEEEQLKDLRKDIENLYEKSHKHFTGTIVAAEMDKRSNHFDIVDGQQRVTTLIILLREIYKTDILKYKDVLSLFFYRGEAGNVQHVLTPNEETRVFFNDLILGNNLPEIKIKSHACIEYAQRFFREWLAEDNSNPDKIYKVVTQLLGFIFFAPPGDKEIGIMFEVINNRGKKLSELEKIKNYFIYFATIHGKATLRTIINDKWREIQENLSEAGQTSNEDENSFLRFCYIVFYEANKEKSHAVYEQMKVRYSPQEKIEDKINQQVTEMERFVIFLANSSRNYAYFFKSGHYMNRANGANAGRINKTLSYLRCQPVNASVMPLYLAIMNSFNQPQPAGFADTEKRVADLLEYIEIANFRLYVLPGVFARADTKQGDMFYFANEFFRVPDWLADPVIETEGARFNESVIHNGNIYDWLEVELREMILNQCPVKKIIEVLTLDKEEEYDYYNWRDGLRFFLSCYEEKKKRDNGLTYNIERMLKLRNEVKDTPNEYLSIEHIWARENLSDHFNGMHIEKRRLGNLVLMGLSANISQQNFDIPEKVSRLVTENHVGRGSLDLHQIADLETILKKALMNSKVADYKRKTHNYYHDLAKAICDIRETELIKFALDRWTLPVEDESVFHGVDSFWAADLELTYNYQLTTDKNFTKIP
jgi:uncharacterized protein with ParB-like and HNH nuclease domain